MVWGSNLIGVVNASPLIYLSKLGILDLLPKMFKEIFTVQEVKTEVLRKEEAPELPALRQAFSNWLKIKSIRNKDLLSRLLDLPPHLGEATVLTLAKEISEESQETVIIIDDLAAREIARAMRLKITGTLGVLLRGWKIGLLAREEVKIYLKRLNEETDFRMTVKIYSKILEQLAE